MHYPFFLPLLPFAYPLYPSIHPFPVPVSFAPRFPPPLPVQFFAIIARAIINPVKFKQAQLELFGPRKHGKIPVSDNIIISFRMERRKAKMAWREILRKWNERAEKNIDLDSDPPLISVSKIAMIMFFSKFPYKSQ